MGNSRVNQKKKEKILIKNIFNVHLAEKKREQADSYSIIFFHKFFISQQLTRAADTMFNNRPYNFHSINWFLFLRNDGTQ